MRGADRRETEEERGQEGQSGPKMDGQLTFVFLAQENSIMVAQDGDGPQLAPMRRRGKTLAHLCTNFGTNRLKDLAGACVRLPRPRDLGISSSEVYHSPFPREAGPGSGNSIRGVPKVLAACGNVAGPELALLRRGGARTPGQQTQNSRFSTRNGRLSGLTL